MNATHALTTRPKSVALVALGVSFRAYVAARVHKKDSLCVDEVWVVNSAADVFSADKVWLMDDLRKMEERYPDWSARLRTCQTPIITCREYPEYPTAVAYPIDQVCAALEDDWFTTTVAYAVGYAMLIGVKDLFVFGADFMYPGSRTVEPGADCVAYWLGRARERGVHYRLPVDSTLLDSNMCQLNAQNKLRRPLYGYDYNPGDSKARVERGEGTALDHLVARKAPHNIQELTYGPKLAVSRVEAGSENGADGNRPREPVHPAGDERSGADLLAERRGVLRGRSGSAYLAGVGAGPDREVQPGAHEADRLDAGHGDGETVQRVELHLADAGVAPHADRFEPRSGAADDSAGEHAARVAAAG